MTSPDTEYIDNESTFMQNQALYGASMIITNPRLITLTGTIFQENIAVQAAGIYIMLEYAYTPVYTYPYSPSFGSSAVFDSVINLNQVTV